MFKDCIGIKVNSRGVDFAEMNAWLDRHHADKLTIIKYVGNRIIWRKRTNKKSLYDRKDIYITPDEITCVAAYDDTVGISMTVKTINALYNLYVQDWR